MSTITKELTKKEIEEIINKYSKYESLSKNPYVIFHAKLETETITIYTSNKMVLQK